MVWTQEGVVRFLRKSSGNVFLLLLSNSNKGLAGRNKSKYRHMKDLKDICKSPAFVFKFALIYICIFPPTGQTISPTIVLMEWSELSKKSSKF